jgi:hypothetical protein
MPSLATSGVAALERGTKPRALGKGLAALMGLDAETLQPATAEPEAASPGLMGDRATLPRRPFDPVALELALALMTVIHEQGKRYAAVNAKLREIGGDFAPQVGEMDETVSAATFALINRVIGPEPNSDMGTYLAHECFMGETFGGRMETREFHITNADGSEGRFPMGSVDDLRTYVLAMEAEHTS